MAARGGQVAWLGWGDEAGGARIGEKKLSHAYEGQPFNEPEKSPPRESMLSHGENAKCLGNTQKF